MKGRSTSAIPAIRPDLAISMPDIAVTLKRKSTYFGVPNLLEPETDSNGFNCMGIKRGVWFHFDKVWCASLCGMCVFPEFGIHFFIKINPGRKNELMVQLKLLVKEMVAYPNANYGEHN